MHKKVTLSISRFFPTNSQSWDIIANSHPAYNIFLSHMWLNTWWKYFGANRVPLTVYAKRGDQIIGIAPLVQGYFRIKGIPIFRCISFVDGVETTYRDLLYGGDDVASIFNAFFEHLSSNNVRWDILSLWNIKEDSPTNTFLPELCKKYKLPYIRPEGIKAPFIRLPDSQEIFIKSLKESVRRNINNYQRKLEKIQRAQFVEIVNADRTQVELFINLHQKRWLKDGHPGVFANETVKAFYKDILLELSRIGQHVLYAILIDDKPVAMASRFLYGKTMHSFLEGWDPDWKALGVGKLAVFYTIKKAIERHLEEYDFSIGDYDYKYDYATGARTNQNYIIFRSKSKMKSYELLGKLQKIF